MTFCKCSKSTSFHKFFHFFTFFLFPTCSFICSFSIFLLVNIRKGLVCLLCLWLFNVYEKSSLVNCCTAATWVKLAKVFNEVIHFFCRLKVTPSYMTTFSEYLTFLFFFLSSLSPLFLFFLFSSAYFLFLLPSSRAKVKGGKM